MALSFAASSTRQNASVFMAGSLPGFTTDSLDDVSFGEGSRCVGMTSLAEHLVSDELWELF
ncbi:hypothetical protein, partial [Streptomyces tauricus]